MGGNRPKPQGFDFDRGEEPSLEEVADEIYGAHRERLETGRMVGQPIPLAEIWPDLKQPRRAVPAVARGQWTGNPEEIPAVLASWWQAAGGEDISAFLSRAAKTLEEGEERAEDTVTAEWLDLLALAASILHEGLQNPITVVKRNGGYLVETGERRLLAYHVLRL